MMQGYEHLTVWQKAMQLVEDIHTATEGFYGRGYGALIDQMRRAAISIPSNIAEGSMRHTTKEYLRFVAIAQGSLAELETQIMIAFRLRCILQQLYTQLIALAREVGKMLRGLYNGLEKKL